MKVSVDRIVANRHQPRKNFEERPLQELADSIAIHGVLQPLVVRPALNDRYELIAGERRLRAARLCGVTEVPIIIRQNVSEDSSLELAILENIQRDDLNPIEEAIAYQSLIDQCEYTQEEVAERMGKSRAAIANALRLLQLPKVVQEDVVQRRLSAGHARAILAAGDLQEQLNVRDQIISAQLTVRDAEKIVNARKGKSPKVKKGPASSEERLSAQMKFLVDAMRKSLGTKVALKPKDDKSGVLTIEYYSLQDLDRIYRKIHD